MKYGPSASSETRFSVGQRVTSNADGIRLIGQVTEVRLALYGREQLTITQEYYRAAASEAEVESRQRNATGWIRYADECELHEQPYGPLTQHGQRQIERRRREQERKARRNAPLPEAITAFKSEWRFLNNTFPHPVTLDGVTYISVERAFQASRSSDPAYRELIRTTRAGLAAKVGRRVQPPEEWSAQQDRLMEGLLREKFSSLPLRIALLGTGQAELIAVNKKAERYWGVCGGTGENRLGKMLMALRHALSSELAAVGSDRDPEAHAQTAVIPVRAPFDDRPHASY